MLGVLDLVALFAKVPEVVAIGGKQLVQLDDPASCHLQTLPKRLLLDTNVDGIPRHSFDTPCYNIWFFDIVGI